MVIKFFIQFWPHFSIALNFLPLSLPFSLSLYRPLYIVLNLVRRSVAYKSIGFSVENCNTGRGSMKNAESNIHYAYYNVKNSTNMNFDSKSGLI